jgi:hypothetical protein
MQNAPPLMRYHHKHIAGHRVDGGAREDLELQRGPTPEGSEKRGPKSGQHGPKWESKGEQQLPVYQLPRSLREAIERGCGPSFGRRDMACSPVRWLARVRHRARIGGCTPCAIAADDPGGGTRVVIASGAAVKWKDTVIRDFVPPPLLPPDFEDVS